MFETTIRDLFRSLEQVIHERLRVIEDVLRVSASGPVVAPSQDDEVMKLKEAVSALSQRMVTMAKHISVLEGKIRNSTTELLPTHPLEGIEVIPKKEVVITAEPVGNGSLSIADRLLLNTKARKALEAEEMGEGIEEHPVLEETEIVEGSEGAEEVVQEQVVKKGGEAEAADEEVVQEEQEAEEEQAAEEEAEEEAEEVELEEFEYKGSTYYRDTDNNVFMTDEDGELLEDPIGVWNEAKQKILVRKPSA